MVKNIRSDEFYNKSPEPEQMIDSMYSLLKCKKHESQSRSFFLYREIANILVEILITTKDLRVKKYCSEKLLKRLQRSGGDKLRAIGDSLSSLPINLETPVMPRFDSSNYSETSLKRFLENFDVKRNRWLGRSLINETKGSYIVIKFAKKGDRIADLIKESFWMEYLNAFYGSKFTVPDPLGLSSNYLLSFKEVDGPKGFELHKERYAIAYQVSKNYYIYPNENRGGMDQDLFKGIVLKNAKLLGKLTGNGIIHTALIPLFHNRVQTDRREDNGLYIWEKGGRLDNWLVSCEYPNFGLSGLRDFEHVDIYVGDTNQLYKEIGNHILSFILVVGSFFRNVGKDGINGKNKIGRFGKSESKPLDTRDLFDITFFKDVIDGIFSNYYEGFTGTSKDTLTSDLFLIERLVEEMGVDNHMEEVIRVVDQKELSQKEFELLLTAKGIESDGAIKKGDRDLIINSGPHLGSFNGKISVPELTDYLVRTSSFCILEKYLSKGNL